MISSINYTWLGHASIRLEIGGQVLLIDPWLSGNPSFPDDRRAEAVDGVTAILVTHGHFDHVSDVAGLARELSVPVYGMVELAGWLSEVQGVTDATGFNKGGTVRIGDVSVTMVGASHSSSMAGPEGTSLYLGEPAGFMISDGARTVYVSGDTDVMADMAIWNDLHAPEIGILCAGGHFTMDMTRAAYAASRLFSFATVIPVHYRTFPLLEQSADALVAGVPDAQVLTPEVMERVAL